jgi:hypothetical protein
MPMLVAVTTFYSELPDRAVDGITLRSYRRLACLAMCRLSLAGQPAKRKLICAHRKKPSS